MTHRALARKWRPRIFSQIVGQEHVVQALTNALRHQRLHHAYLFTGTRGVGKTTIARILAKALNCEAAMDIEPCGVCPICRDIDEGRFLDLIEVDAASRTKVEDTRDLMDNVQYAPSRGRYKVYLIDEVHMLSGHSFNALLKTLEEPPAHVKFLLATTDPHKIPVTVLSRCLQFNLKRLTPMQISAQMTHILREENIPAETAAIQLLARAAEGSMRDGLSLLDQAIVHGDNRVTHDAVVAMLGVVAHEPLAELLRALARRDAATLLATVGHISEFNPDFPGALQELLRLLQRIAVAQLVPDAVEYEADVALLHELAGSMTPEDVQLSYQIALLGLRDLPLAPDPRGGFEMILLRMLAFTPMPTTATPRAKSAAAPSSVLLPTSATPEVANNAPTESSAESLAAPTATLDWEGMIAAMRLTGPVRELASHCSLQRITEKYCHLSLMPGYLRSPRAVTNLQETLTRHLGRPIEVVFDEAPADTPLMTPRVKQQQQRDARQRAAEQAIAEDNTIHALQERFDAKVLPGTTEPVDL